MWCPTIVEAGHAVHLWFVRLFWDGVDGAQGVYGSVVMQLIRGQCYGEASEMSGNKAVCV